MDLKTLVNELVAVKSRLDELWRRFERQAVNENLGGGGGGGSTTVHAPLTNAGTPTNPDLSLAVSPAASGGAVALQGSSPGTAQTGNLNISGNAVIGGAVSPDSINAIGPISSLTSLSAPAIVRSNLELGLLGSSFPLSPNNNQRYFHTTYKSSFIYDATGSKWYQEFPGAFNGSFPTVASGDNTIAPKIEVKRTDIGNAVFFWDGAVWQTKTGALVMLPGIARIIDDTTARAAGYTNSAIQVTGVNLTDPTKPLPTGIKTIITRVSLLASTVAGATPGSVACVLDNPDSPNNSSALSAYVDIPGRIITGEVTTGVSNAGTIKIVINGTGTSRFVIDVIGYQLNDASSTILATAQGTTFPTSPSVNQRFYRTDRNIEYYWNGTNWLSSNLISLPLMTQAGQQPFPQGNNNLVAKIPRNYVNGWYLEDVSWEIFCTTAQSAANYYNIVALTVSNTGPTAAFTPVSGTVNTQLATTANKHYSPNDAIVFNTARPASEFLLIVQAQVALGNPGTYYFAGTANIRLIG